MSRSGEYRVTVLSRRADIKGDELLGKSVSVKVVTPRGGLREFNGLAAGFYQVGQQGRYHRYLIVVRPWTWLLTRTSDCKIFQDKTVRQIIEAVLADHPYADFEFQLAGQYTPWGYCVQYRESDFNFLARLISVRLQAIPSAQTYQAPRLTPKPIVQGNETVSVTGKLDHTIMGAASYTSPTSITLSVGGSTVEIKPTSITLSFGASSIKIDAMGIAQMGPKISLNG